MGDITSGAVKRAIDAVCPMGTEYITVPQVASMLGIHEDVGQMMDIRAKLNQLVRAGKLRRVGNRKWQPVTSERRRGEGYTRMWRAIRSSASGFCAADICRLAVMDRSTVCKFLRHLHDIGLVRRTSGKNGCTLYYVITNTGRMHRETPYPPKVVAIDPYQDSRSAAAELCRIMMIEDPGKERVQWKIRGHVKVFIQNFFPEMEMEGLRNE